MFQKIISNILNHCIPLRYPLVLQGQYLGHLVQLTCLLQFQSPVECYNLKQFKYMNGFYNQVFIFIF